jgi:hypothetical protein
MSAHSGMPAALGPYPMNREASGTAWQPDSSPHGGFHEHLDDWMIMSHGWLDTVYDRQDGPRGGDKTFLSGMLMSAATRELDELDTMRLRVMLSPEPLMGASGYPLLLATGETANGINPLIDRQHPHDLVMELSTSMSHAFDAEGSVFIYAGLPGEPAFGPPAFMHRLSAEDDPAAPISHHWLDSTHLTEGVVTVGGVLGDWKMEVSRFYGREPDQHRYAIEPGPLDSTAARLSVNPTSTLSLQVSWARQISPEQLAPTKDETRATASAIYTRALDGGRFWSTTAAFGYRRSTGEHGLTASLLESAWQPLDAWTLFGRYEQELNNELVGSTLGGGPDYRVSTVSFGAIRDVRMAAHLRAGIGALYAWNFLPDGLLPLYGHDPGGLMAFLRVKID